MGGGLLETKPNGIQRLGKEILAHAPGIKTSAARFVVTTPRRA
jgi:hypothetical protein